MVADTENIVDRHLTRATEDNRKLRRYVVLLMVVALLAAGLGTVAAILWHDVDSWPSVAGLGGGLVSSFSIARVTRRRSASRD